MPIIWAMAEISIETVFIAGFRKLLSQVDYSFFPSAFCNILWKWAGESGICDLRFSCSNLQSLVSYPFQRRAAQDSAYRKRPPTFNQLTFAISIVLAGFMVCKLCTAIQWSANYASRRSKGSVECSRLRSTTSLSSFENQRRILDFWYSAAVSAFSGRNPVEFSFGGFNGSLPTVNDNSLLFFRGRVSKKKTNRKARPQTWLNWAR